MQKMRKKIIGLLLGLLCALIPFPASVFSAEAIDTTKDVTLTIQYAREGKAIPDAEFSLYQAGTVDAYGKVTLTGPFASYPISIDGLDKDGWNALALTLAGFVQRDRLTPLDSGKTDADGRLKFPYSSSVTMKPGLYLVIGKNCTVDPLYLLSDSIYGLPAGG